MLTEQRCLNPSVLRVICAVCHVRARCFLWTPWAKELVAGYEEHSLAAPQIKYLVICCPAAAWGAMGVARDLVLHLLLLGR